MNKISKICFVLFIVMGCSTLPKESYRAFLPNVRYGIENDTLQISIINTIKAPLRMDVNSKDDLIQKQLENYFPVVMKPLDTLQFKKASTIEKKEIKLGFSFKYGSLTDTVRDLEFELPFQVGKEYRVMQGYQGTFSHQSDYSKYAIDFRMNTDQIICAAADGVVVGLINQYTKGGPDRKWRDFANLITIYHPDRGLFSQYVHIDFESNFINLGDSVKAGQPIARAGNTGWTTASHLHFNVLKASEASLSSYPITFKEGLEGRMLKQGKRVRKRSSDFK